MYEEKAKIKKRQEVKDTLGQLVADFACLAATDQPNYCGGADEPTPQVFGACGEDAKVSPRNAIICLNMNNKKFVPNSHTIDGTFCLDGSPDTELARQFLGLSVDTLSMYHASTMGVKAKDLQSSYRQKGLFKPEVFSKLNCSTPTVQGWMERIVLPRDLHNKDHDTLLRLWFSAIRSPSHVTEDYNCQPLKLALEARQSHMSVAHGKSTFLRWGAGEMLTADQMLASWNYFHEAPEDEQDVTDSDPKGNLGLCHIETFGNPRSKYFSTLKDRPELLCTIPNNIDKEMIVALRQQILRLKNNPDSYIQRDANLEDVFRPHEMKNFFKLPTGIFTAGGLELASQKLGKVKTPSGIEKHMPQHLKLSDTHVLLQKRASNKKHYDQLRHMLPLSSCEIEGDDGTVTQIKHQDEIVTPEKYWMLWLPSTLRREQVERTKSSGMSSPQYLFDIVDTSIQDREVYFNRYDTCTPEQIQRPDPQKIISAAPGNGEDDESDAYDSNNDPSDEDFEDLLESSIDKRFDLRTRYNEFLLAVDRFVKGSTGKSHKTTHLPMWMWEYSKDGKSVPYDSEGSKEATGVRLEIPYIPDWVEAHRAASEMPPGTDAQILKTAKNLVNTHVTEAIKFTKVILARTRFHTDPVCITKIAKVYVFDQNGERVMQPKLDDEGNQVEDEDGDLVEEPVYTEIAVRVGVHYARPFPKNKLHTTSMEKILNYCSNSGSVDQKPLPILQENCPKSRTFETVWASGEFSEKPDASQRAKSWWEKRRHQPKSSPAYIANLKQYIQNGVDSDFKGLSSGPDWTRSQFSVTQAALIENSITFKNGEMGVQYLKDLGDRVWVSAINSPECEWYIKKAIQPWFDDTYTLGATNKWEVNKDRVVFPELWRLDPDHAFEDVFETALHEHFNHIGSVYNQYKYCHLVYATFGTAFQKPESNELASSSDSTAVSLKFVGGHLHGKISQVQPRPLPFQERPARARRAGQLRPVRARRHVGLPRVCHVVFGRGERRQGPRNAQAGENNADAGIHLERSLREDYLLGRRGAVRAGDREQPHQHGSRCVRKRRGRRGRERQGQRGSLLEDLGRGKSRRLHEAQKHAWGVLQNFEIGDHGVALHRPESV